MWVIWFTWIREHRIREHKGCSIQGDLVPVLNAQICATFIIEMAHWFASLMRPRFEPARREPEEKVTIPFVPPSETEGDDDIDEPTNERNNNHVNNVAMPPTFVQPHFPFNTGPFIPPESEEGSDTDESTNERHNHINNVAMPPSFVQPHFPFNTGPFIPPSEDGNGIDESTNESTLLSTNQSNNGGHNVGVQQTSPGVLIRLKPYRFRPSKDTWKHARTFGLRNDIPAETRRAPCSQVRIITWNIDFTTEHPKKRLTACLRHIEEDVLQCRPGRAPDPCCILLQEVLATVIPHLLRDQWVRNWFFVAPYSSRKWPEGAYYGNVTLVSRSLTIAECHMFHYGLTKMERTSLCVKLRLNYPGSSRETAFVCVVNTHLESLPDGAVWRPYQLDMCSRFLRLHGVIGGVIAGDMNTITLQDEGIEKDVGLRDAWRKGSADFGNTWGYQGQNEKKFPVGRLDKVFYLPAREYKVDEPRRVGVGLKTKGESSNEVLWASDHYGLETTLRMMKRTLDSSDL